ncbi:MAG: porin family protein [Gramella sp.]|nr:porin family protein [Christiangramia sp.]
MKQRKNIDRIFQENFKDFEREPNEELWGNISSRLDKKEKKKTLLIPLWMKVGSVAAVMALIISSLLFTTNESPVSSDPEVVFEKPQQTSQDKKPSDSQDEIDKNTSTQDQVVFEHDQELKDGNTSHSNNRSSSITSTKPSSNSKSKQESGKPSPSTKGLINNSRIVVEKITPSSSEIRKEKRLFQPEGDRKINLDEIALEEILLDSTETILYSEENNALAELAAKKENSDEDETIIEKPKSQNIRLSTFAAPVFYKNIGSGNELSNQFSNNSSSSEVTFSYGVKVAYELTERLRIRTGISKINISNNIQDISYSPTASAVALENVSPTEDNIDIRSNTFGSGEIPAVNPESDNSLTSMIFTPGEINQQLGYIEVPLELEFSLIDKKFGLNLIGGGSSLFLDNNQVDLLSGENRTKLGKASNINNTSFSTNIGLGIDYQLTDKFSFSVEPIFKYQINTFNNVDNVQPVNFGVYSGLNFRF